MKIAIIGAGAVGMGVASKLAREKTEVAITVFQEESYISLGACGIPYFIANDFKKADLLNARTTKDFADKTKFTNQITFKLNCQINSVDLANQKLTYQNIKKTNSQSKTFNYDYLVIATGAKPKVVPPYNSETWPDNLFTVSNKADAINIKAAAKKVNNVVIIGGSYIGLEVAESCLKLKKKVTIIEAQERLMANVVSSEFSDLIYQEMTTSDSTTKHKSQAKFLLKTQTKELLMQDNEIKAIATNTGHIIKCDLVILAIGAAPNVTALKNNDVRLLPNQAIVINEYAQVMSNDNAHHKVIDHAYQNVFAGGDCASVTNQTNGINNYIALATSANKIARVIAHNIINKDDKVKFPGTLGSSIIRVKHLEIATTGIKDSAWNNNNIASVFIRSHDLPSYMPDSKPLFLKLFYDKTSYQLLAAQMAGYNHATLRINALATAIWNKMNVKDLQYLDLVYAPPFATTVDIIQLAARQIK